jgi:transposase InsO family protein
MLEIAPSTHHAHEVRRRCPEKAPPRVKTDMALRPEIQRIYDQNFQVYGVRKVWRQMLREGFAVARCTVARLMKAMGLKGVILACTRFGRRLVSRVQPPFQSRWG